jgi:hypothetical protein
MKKDRQFCWQLSQKLKLSLQTLEIPNFLEWERKMVRWFPWQKNTICRSSQKLHKLCQKVVWFSRGEINTESTGSSTYHDRWVTRNTSSTCHQSLTFTDTKSQSSKKYCWQLMGFLDMNFLKVSFVKEVVNKLRTR